MTENTLSTERVILVAADIGEGVDSSSSLDELEQLADTAGATTVGRVIQNLPGFDKATYIGSGKVQELKLMAEELHADGIICDDELSPAQARNLERILDIKVMDRTLLILDIFAARASSREGKIQVELAQLKYRMTRLAGGYSELSRLGGGIGTRGPGEKKLESDRRLIAKRISRLKGELEEVEHHRQLLHTSRSKKIMPVCALTGYTNAGKSTLLNTLTGADVLSEDKLFATLDPTTRKLELPDGQTVLITDTVGFIRKLPHKLVEAFKSTLEEVLYADVIVHVADASNEQMEVQMQVVYDTLAQLGVKGTPVMTVFNKMDQAEEGRKPVDRKADEMVYVSAKTGEGLEELQKTLVDILNAGLIEITRIYDYKDAGKIQLIRDHGQLLEEKYEADGIHVHAYVPKEIYGRT